MRIKKKHVLLESNLLDTLNEFNPKEKRLLFVLNKEYGPHDYKTFNIWDAAAWLIELFEIPYDLAYELSTTYYYNGEKLFGDHKSLRKNQNSGEIFFRHAYEFLKGFKKELTNKNPSEREDVVGDINIEFSGDDFGEFKSSTSLNREVTMWDNNHGYTLYIPLPRGSIGDWPNEIHFRTTETDDRLLMVDVKFKEIKTPQEGKYDYEGDPDKFNVNVNVRVGDNPGNRDGYGYILTDWMSFEVPLPKPLSIKNVNDTLTGIYEDVIKKLKSTKFKLPSDAKPLKINKVNVDYPPDSQH